MKILDTAMTEIVKGNSARYYSKYVVDGKEHAETLNNFKFQNMINPNNEITIGNTCASSVTFSIYMPAISLENKEIAIFEGVKVGTEIKYIKLGIFTVTKQTSDGEYTSYEAYDRMYKADMPYFSDMAFPSTDKAILNEICGKLGISLATNIVLAHTISDKPQGYTYREIIGYMAMLQGCNAVINSDGNLELRWYKDSGYVLDGHKYYQQGVTFTTSKDFIIQKLTCNNTKSGSTEQSQITSGDGATGLSFANPFMTQAILDEVYEKIGGFQFRPLTVKFVGDYRLEVGDIITVNKSGVDYKVPIMQITHECDGGLMDTVTSIGQSDTENTSVASGPITKQMERYYADLILVNKALINKLSVDEADIRYASIETLKAVNADIDNLKTNKLDATYADIINANVESLKAANAEITQLKANSLTANIADLKYAQIDFANVKGQVVTTSLIKDGAVTNEKVQSLSANKLTAGTIDASKITVTNLNADNITVGTINGKRIGTGSLSLDKLAEEVPTKEYLDKVQEDLQGQIDGNIETFTKTEIPTLNNEPAVNWTDNATRKKHIGDICYVVNPASSADGYSYRFANTGTEQAPVYEWVLIKDSDVTKALQDIININGEINGIKKFNVEISSWKTDTDDELSSLKTRTTNLETDMGNKVNTTTFNEVKQTVDENSSTITNMSETLSEKADSSTVATLSNTVNSIKQTTDSNTSSISSLTTTVTKVENTANSASKTATAANNTANTAKSTADSALSKVNTLTTTVTNQGSSITQLQGSITNKVWKTDITESVNNLQIGGRNLLTGSAGWTKANPAKSINEPDGYVYIGGRVYLENGKTYTLQAVSDSVWAPVHFGQTGEATIWIHGLEDEFHRVFCGDGKTSGRYTWTFVHTSATQNCEIRINGYSKISSFWDIKIESGNKATDWTPAPEDVDSSINAVDNKVTTVEQNLNGLTVDVTNQYQYIDNQLNGNHKIYEITHAPTKDNYPANEWSIQIYPSDDRYPSDSTWEYTEDEYEKYVGTIAYWKDQQRAWRFIRKSDGTHDWVEISATETTYLLNQNASLRIDVNNISTSLSSLTNNVQNNYSTTTQMNSAITQAVSAESGSIKSEISKTYVTNGMLSDSLSGIDESIGKLQEDQMYYTKTEQLDNYIKQLIEDDSTETSIVLKGAYTTQDSLGNTLKSYATTASLDLYIKKDPTSGELKSAIEAIADDITLNASGTINISGNKSVNINGNLFTLTSTNTTISADGSIDCKKLKAVNADLEGTFKNVNVTEEGITMTTTLIGGEYLMKSSTGAYLKIQGHFINLSNEDGTRNAVSIRRDGIYVDDYYYIRSGDAYYNLMDWIRHSETAGTVDISGNNCYIEGYYYIRHHGEWWKLEDYVEDIMNN